MDGGHVYAHVIGVGDHECYNAARMERITIIARHGSYTEGSPQLDKHGREQVQTLTEFLSLLLMDRQIQLYGDTGPRAQESTSLIEKTVNLVRESSAARQALQLSLHEELLYGNVSSDRLVITNGKRIYEFAHEFSTLFCCPNPFQGYSLDAGNHMLPPGPLHVLIIDHQKKTINNVTIN